jgi:hypothetical protein
VALKAISAALMLNNYLCPIVKTVFLAPRPFWGVHRVGG